MSINTTDTITDGPRIYVACLRAYNAGILHGRWIDATQDADDIMADITAMLAESPADGDCEEWAIHDHEGFEGVNIGEYDRIETVAELAGLVEEYGEPFAAYYNHVGGDVDGVQFEDAYAGEYDSEEAFAEEIAGDGYSTDDLGRLANYIDWGRYARDLFMGDYFSEDTGAGRVYVFRAI